MVKRKTVVFGFDGATWDIINPLIKSGKMPNLARLINEGVSGILRSFEPMASPILWTSISSGKLPDKHGVGAFLLNSNNVKCKRIWDILEEKGWSIGLSGHLLCWPPRKINGYIIPDDTFSKGVETYPEELSFIRKLAEAKRRNKLGTKEYLYYLKECLSHGISITNLLKGFGLSIRSKFDKNQSFLDSFYKIRGIRDVFRRDLFFALDKKYNPDYSFYYTNLADACSHLYWKYMEPEKYKDVPADEIKKFRNIIKNSYMEADKFLGKLLERADDDWTICVVSDHGFKAADVSEEGWLYSVKTEFFSELLGISDKVVGYNLGPSAILKFKDKYKDEMDHYAELIEKITFAESGQKVFTTFSDEFGVHCAVDEKTGDNRDRGIVFPGKDGISFDDIVESSTRINGVHHIEGILVLKGPDVEAGKIINGASVMDITPTLLALSGIEVGKDMDGKVLTDAINPDFLIENPVQYIDTHESAEKTEMEENDEDDGYSENIKEKLRALGYLE